MLLQLLFILLCVEKFLNKELVVFHYSREKGEQLKCRKHPVPWNGRDSATLQYSMKITGAEGPGDFCRSGGPVSCVEGAPLSALIKLCLRGGGCEWEGECWLGSQGPDLPSVR